MHGGSSNDLPLTLPSMEMTPNSVTLAVLALSLFDRSTGSAATMQDVYAARIVPEPLHHRVYIRVIWWLRSYSSAQLTPKLPPCRHYAHCQS